jgi:MFS family permease
MKHSPQRIGLTPYGESESLDRKRPPASAVRSFTFKEAIRTERFWLLAAIFFCFHYYLAAVETHIVPYATDIGISPAVSAIILSLVSAGSIGGKLSIGFISDKKEARFTLGLYLAMLGLSLTGLLFARHIVTLYAFAIVFGIGYGGVLTYFPGITSQLFGLQHLSMIYAAATLFGTLGRSASPILSGSLFDINGNYYSAFLILAVLGALSFVLAMILLRHKSKKADSTV